MTKWWAVLACSAALGCSTGTDSGAGGSGGTSGSANNAGGSSTGGASGAGTCASGVTHPPAAALITDFSDAVPDPANEGQFLFGGGDATRMQGGISTFANPASTKGTLSVENDTLTFAATVSDAAESGPDQYPFNGFVLYFAGPACVDGSAYDGVTFELGGDLGDCVLHFSFSYAQNFAQSVDADRGLCTESNCYPAEYEVPLSTTYVNFADDAPIAGVPVGAVDPKKLVGVQWQLVPSTGTSCTATLTVSNVKFK